MLGEVLENIGQSVAVEVVSWTDIIPEDPRWGFQEALARRDQHCDAFRHPKPRLLSGSSVLFPKQEYPPAGKLLVIQAETVKKAVSLAPPKTRGRVGILVIGCISYRASFEAPDTRRHQTQFMYALGRSDRGRGMPMLIEPSGTMSDLGLILIPEASSAD